MGILQALLTAQVGSPARSCVLMVVAVFAEDWAIAVAVKQADRRNRNNIMDGVYYVEYDSKGEACRETTWLDSPRRSRTKEIAVSRYYIVKPYAIPHPATPTNEVCCRWSLKTFSSCTKKIQPKCAIFLVQV